MILGEHTLLQNSEPLPRQKYRVTKVHMHPLYQQTPQVIERTCFGGIFHSILLFRLTGLTWLC